MAFVLDAESVVFYYIGLYRIVVGDGLEGRGDQLGVHPTREVYGSEPLGFRQVD